MTPSRRIDRIRNPNSRPASRHRRHCRDEHGGARHRQRHASGSGGAAAGDRRAAQAESNSKREWPAAIAFSHNARLLGAHTAGAASSHAPFSSPKRLLLLASRPAPRDLPRLPFHVDHLGRRIALSPTHILPMLLAYLRQLG
ncbi:heat shock 70 kDa protein 16 [Hordeum vulgare]|nr:heat shock 70 kDa protein 16 [Hordeum vulgare]